MAQDRAMQWSANVVKTQASKTLFQRFSVAAKGQLMLFSKEPIRYIFSEVLPIPAGGTIYDFLSGRSIYAEMFSPGGEGIMATFKKHQQMQRQAGLERNPLLVRAFTPSYWKGAREFNAKPVEEQQAAYAQKVEALGKYMAEIRALKAKSLQMVKMNRERLRTQDVLTKINREAIKTPPVIGRKILWKPQALETRNVPETRSLLSKINRKPATGFKTPFRFKAR